MVGFVGGGDAVPAVPVAVRPDPTDRVSGGQPEDESLPQGARHRSCSQL